jgi:hypothetical protein
MKTIQEQTEINAPKEEVWKILTDFKNYKHWNPFIVKIKGTPKKGNKININMKQKNKTYKLTPTIQEFQKNKQLTWKGKIFIPGIFDAEHQFTLKKINKNKTKFTQKENFSGILSGIILNSIEKETKNSFKKMNNMLKKKSERRENEPNRLAQKRT